MNTLNKAGDRGRSWRDAMPLETRWGDAVEATLNVERPTPNAEPGRPEFGARGPMLGVRRVLRSLRQWVGRSSLCAPPADRGLAALPEAKAFIRRGIPERAGRFPGNSARAAARGVSGILVLITALTSLGAAEPIEAEVKSASVQGHIDGETARLVIQANLGGLTGAREPAIWSASIRHRVTVGREKVTHTFDLAIDSIRGGLRELMLPWQGEGEIRSASGEGLADWSVRQDAKGGRALVLRLREAEKPVTAFRGQVLAESRIESVPQFVQVLTLSTEQPALANGYVRVDVAAVAAGLEIGDPSVSGLVPVEPEYLPEDWRQTGGVAPTRAYRFHGGGYSLGFRVKAADPEAGLVTMSDFGLAGELADESAAFTLTGTARVRDPKGGRLELLAGGVALAEMGERPGWGLEFEEGRYWARFEKAGEFPIKLRFNAAVRGSNEWNRIEFRVAAGALAPVVLRGLGPETTFELAGAARPERTGDRITSHLPASGVVQASWRLARPETEGRLFYSAEAVAQVAVSPGLLRQTTLLELRIMQGELSRVTLALRGEGEVTRVQGPQVLAWSVEPATGAGGAGERRLVVQFNQVQREVAAVQVQMQRPLGAFPLAFEAPQVVPEGATRFGGYLRVVNQGAVRLETVEATGLSQISPEQFVQTEATQALLPPQVTQVFAYRFAGPGFRLRIQADNILPELGVSQVLVAHLGETELAIDAELEVDVREAPMRELSVRVPRGYSLARLNAAGVSDHFLTEPAGEPDALLRLVYGAPVSGRQAVQFRLERNQAFGDARWVLPRIEVVKAKSVRGHVGVSADAGFRVTPVGVTGLTELAPAFFPRKVPGLQAAFRLSEPGWQATVTVERLAQSVQADAFHLFSVGEGIAYGSSVLNYMVSGAPISTLQVELSAEYFNVEFTGKNIRNWQKTERGYQVQLHTPVSGAYMLLATYERPFKAQGETLTFAGARPLDAQSEQGYTLAVSAYQFEVKPANVSASLTPIEPGEVPAEYRLFFDAPILAAYRYSARPFNLELALKPLAQAEMVSQVVDRAALTTRISEEGQIVTEARYFLKTKGAPHLRLRLPEGAELWSVTVDGAGAVPVRDGASNLIPLPNRADPNEVVEVQAKIAAKARRAGRLSVTAPSVAAPVLLGEWKLEPSANRRLVYRGGTLTPANGIPDRSGFGGLMRLWGSDRQEQVRAACVVLFLATLVGAGVWSGRLTGNGGRRWSHLAAGVVGGVAAVVAAVTGAQLVAAAMDAGVPLATGLSFVAPVQQGDVAWRVDVGNVARDGGTWLTFSAVLLCLAAGVVWVYAWLDERGWVKRVGGPLGWTLLAWASLRLGDGAPAFFVVVVAFVLGQVLAPSLVRWWRTRPATMAGTTPPAAAAAALLLAVVGLGSLGMPRAQAQAQAQVEKAPGEVAVVAETVRHEIRVQDDFVFGSAELRWVAKKGDVLALLMEPGVLVRSGHPTNAARLVQVTRQGRRTHLLVAEADRAMDFTIEYQARVTAREAERGFLLPVRSGLVNRARLNLPGLDVDVTSPQAVLVQRAAESGETNTVATLVLAPAPDTWIGWRPRTRDTRREKAVFYAELAQLYVPGPGVVEGLHLAQIRPAQGELAELTFEVPEGLTVTDVVAPGLALWRFDPDQRRLRVGLSPAQSRPFVVQVKSQLAATPLPFERSAGLLRVTGAAGQIGMVGVATGAEVQLDDVRAEGFSAVNLEDFPGVAVEALRGQTPGLTLRRAFRYGTPEGTVAVKASAVEPDVRVEAQQTLSLGEDRTVLAATLDVEVLRAGIFKLSFALPAGLDVESVSGEAMSHWTELRTDAGRTVTLHLKGRTQGKQRFQVTLAGAGVKSASGWNVPRLSLREASKQRGQLLIVPEQGLRLQVANREGVTQLDPVQAGVRQKGVLAFRLLQDAWTLGLDLEQVDAWTQVTSLQHVALAEAQVKVTANLQYEIENTGVKSLAIRLPGAAESVRFRGEHVADFLARPVASGTTSKVWDVKLERRVIGRYGLQVAYILPLAEGATDAQIEGVQAEDVNLQRGFVTVQTGGRLQARIEPPESLQPTDWQVIPRTLQQGVEAAAANYAFRLVEPAFRLPVTLVRHEAARLLPARMNGVTLTSVVSDDGAALTQVQMRLVPGDKRLLHVTLPMGSRFWFAFVNQNSVWPWQATNQVLIPLEQASRTGEEATVEFFYTGTAGAADRKSLEIELRGPRFDLPMENIVWNLFLNEKWRLLKWHGSLQLQDEQVSVRPVAIDLESYVSNEAQLRQAKTQEAEQFLNLANTLIQEGDPQEARRAFQNAYVLSQHDQAFNEDARVQLNNLKVQQALVGLNVRQARVAGGSSAIEAAPRDLRENRAANYTPSEAKQLFDRNTAEENAVQQRLAERLVQQQEAATAKPAAIRATLPEQGRRITFTRPLEIDPWSELRLGVEAGAAGGVSRWSKLGLLVLVFAGAAVLVAVVRKPRSEAGA